MTAYFPNCSASSIVSGRGALSVSGNNNVAKPEKKENTPKINDGKPAQTLI